MIRITRLYILFIFLSLISTATFAQDATVKSRVDATQVTVGDQVKLFIEASHNEKQSRLQWAVIPDTFNSLEVVEKGKIDTLKNGDVTTYKQRLLVSGYDSGMFKIPAFQFAVMPNGGAPYTIQSDSFQILVQTVPVDTTKPFKGIKGIMNVKSSWMDYIWLIIGGIVLVILTFVVLNYFRKNKKAPMPVVDKTPKETLQQRTLRLLNELEEQKLWQADRIKEYYVQLTDILRGYIEERFKTPAMELTTDELLQKARSHPEMRKHYDQLGSILYTADLAKFAKAQPLVHEHTSTMEYTKQFVINTPPVEQAANTGQNTQQQS